MSAGELEWKVQSTNVCAYSALSQIKTMLKKDNVKHNHMLADSRWSNQHYHIFYGLSAKKQALPVNFELPIRIV